MSYTINEEKSFSKTQADLMKATHAAVTGLEGKVLKEDAENHKIEIQYPKTIHGKVLGDRTVFNVQAVPDGEQAKLVVEAFPVNAVGQKLSFGARKGVTRTVLDWFWAHIDHNLK